MAPLSLLLSFIGKKIGTILQAIFGWSITALFGRLDTKREVAVSVALILSIAWPLFLVGLVFPNVAGWAIAFVPLKEWVGPNVLRLVWAALAVIAPVLVGLLVHFAAPTKRGGYARAIIAGYPLALGLLVSFLVTVVTVPIVKAASILKGWSDTHVFVQPREGRYNDVLRKLAEACARAGFLPEIADAPRRMTIATNVLRFLARSTVQPIMAEQLRVIRADDIEIYVYPSDVLIRGKDQRVALVRAMLTRTDIDADAYLVRSERGRDIQDELARLTDVIRDHERAGRTPGSILTSRIVETWHEMNRAELPYDEWVLLESLDRRLERRLVRHLGAEALRIDDEPDELEALGKKQNDRARPSIGGLATQT